MSKMNSFSTEPDERETELHKIRSATKHLAEVLFILLENIYVGSETRIELEFKLQSIINELEE